MAKTCNSLLDLIFFTFIFSIHRVCANFFIIFLECSQIFPSLRELPLLHPFSNIPVNKGTFGIHQVKLVVQASPGLSNGRGIAQHADCPLDFGQVAPRNHCGGLVIDANLQEMWKRP